jgi:anti-sigma B factor antagonist
MEPVGAEAHATVTAASDNGGALVVSLGGELDMSTVPAIETELASLIAGASPPITFDLSNLEFMDSSGIAMLLRVVGHTEPVVIREPSGTVRQVIQATGLQEVLRIES